MAGVKIPDHAVKAADNRQREERDKRHGYNVKPKNTLSHYRLAPNNNTINVPEQLKELRAKHIEDRRAETTPRLAPDQRRGTALEGMPTTPAELQEWQMRHYDMENFERRARGYPELPIPASMQPAVQAATPVSNQAPPSATDKLVRGLRQKLGLK